MEVLDEGQFLFTDFFNVQYKMEIKIHLNYDRAPSISLGTIFREWARCRTEFLTERHGDNYTVVIVNSRCRMGSFFFFFFGSATWSDDKWPCPEFHFSQKISRLPFLHYYKDAHVSNRMLTEQPADASKEGKAQGGPALASKGMSRPPGELSAVIAYLLA